VGTFRSISALIIHTKRLRDPKAHLSPKFLGHADIKLTLDTYSHFLPSMGDQTAAIKIALG
jgi:hypothetical protein